MARGRKAAIAETKEAVANESVGTTEEVKPTEETVEKNAEVEALKLEIAQLKEMLIAAHNNSVQPVIQVQTPESERIHFLFEAEIADDNVFLVGDNGMYGRIVGKTGSFYIPKNDFSRVNDGLFRMMLEKRWIIALDGFTDEEREALGIAYNEGEYLDKRAFARMVELGDEMLEIYPKLCDGHKEMVAKRYYEAYTAGNPKVTRDLVVKLNKLSKEAGSPKGDFASIIELMNASDTE